MFNVFIKLSSYCCVCPDVIHFINNLNCVLFFLVNAEDFLFLSFVLISLFEGCYFVLLVI